MASRSWTLTIPAPCEWLTANQRLHWAQRASRTRIWRDAAHIYARQAKIPALSRARITITLRFPDRRRRDAGNYAPTAKAIVDGIVDAGVLRDDSDRYLEGPDLRSGDQITGRCLAVVTIWDAAGQDDAEKEQRQ